MGQMSGPAQEVQKKMSEEGNEVAEHKTDTELRPGQLSVQSVTLSPSRAIKSELRCHPSLWSEQYDGRFLWGRARSLN